MHHDAFGSDWREIVLILTPRRLSWASSDGLKEKCINLALVSVGLGWFVIARSTASA